jgi:hypothetical protein
MRAPHPMTGDPASPPLPREGVRIFPARALRSAARRAGRSARISLVVAGVIGCSQPLTGSGYLGTYLDMKPNRYLQAESHLPGLTLDPGTTLLIRPVRPYFRRSTRPAFFRRLADSFQGRRSSSQGWTSPARRPGQATTSGSWRP